MSILFCLTEKKKEPNNFRSKIHQTIVKILVEEQDEVINHYNKIFWQGGGGNEQKREGIEAVFKSCNQNSETKLCFSKC